MLSAWKVTINQQIYNEGILFDYIPKNEKWLIVDFSQIETTENKDGPKVMEKSRTCQDNKDCRQDLGEICIWWNDGIEKTCYLPSTNAIASKGGKSINF